MDTPSNKKSRHWVELVEKARRASAPEVDVRLSVRQRIEIEAKERRRAALERMMPVAGSLWEQLLMLTGQRWMGAGVALLLLAAGLVCWGAGTAVEEMELLGELRVAALWGWQKGVTMLP